MANLTCSVEDIPRRQFLELGLKAGVALSVAPVLLNQQLWGAGAKPGVIKPSLDPGMLDRVIRKALKRGGDFAEVYVETRVSRTLVLEEKRFKSAVFNIMQGAGVRVLSGDRTGYATSDDFSEASLMRSAEVAGAVAKAGGSTRPMALKTPKRPSFITIKQALGDVADEKRMEVMLRAQDAAFTYDPRIKMVSVNYYDELRGRLIANSEGVLLSDELPLIFFIVQTLGVGNGTQHMGRERLSRHSGFELFKDVPPEQVARACARESIVMLDAKDAPAGRTDVVMQNGWGGVLVHEAVGHPLEADSIAKQVGAFTGKVGQKVASDLVTMVDDGTMPNYRGTTNFDDEGTPMQRTVLIRNGVLERYMTDVLSARQLKTNRTGNGRRQDYRYLPIPRMTNTFIEAGKDRPEDILASTKKGIYVQSLSGGSVNSITGVFNFMCREAYLVENGQKTTPIKGATLIGECLEVIRNIDAVGNDLDFGPGICGKGQNAEVTAGQPTIRIRGMNVGGTKA